MPSIVANQIVQTLLAGPLQEIKDPAVQAIITRNAELLAQASARILTLAPEEQGQTQEDIATATAVLASFASAIGEDSANVVRAAISTGIDLGFQLGFKAVGVALAAA